MKKIRIALALLALSGALPALVQGQGTNVPHIDQLQLQIARFIGGRTIPNLAFALLFTQFTDFPQLWANPVPFDPATDTAEEFDLILVGLVVTDADLANQQSGQNELKFFYQVRAFAGSLGPPEPPPLLGVTSDSKFAASSFTLLPAPPANAVFIGFGLQVPRFLGVNQDRLIGSIDWDVFWAVSVEVANEDAPAVGASSGISFSLFARQKPALVPPNPPAFADAGSAQTVAVGSPVILDASQSFDSSNLGFNFRDPNILLKDTLTYAWAWLSGPERVDPQPSPDGDPSRALVTPGLVGDYVYQVVVSDGVSPLPSTATTVVHVVQSIRQNQGPSAVISDGNGNVVSGRVDSVHVGDQIRLSAALSTDPNGDALVYRWRQTNAVGGALQQDEVLVEFQPLNGISARDVAWIATKVGTYYFALLVTDVPPAGLSPLSATASVTVDVTEATTAGIVAERANDQTLSGGASDSGAADTLPATPAGCGGGSVLPLALLPGALWLMRGRRQ